MNKLVQVSMGREEMVRRSLGYSLKKVLEGERNESSISPTDLAMDTHEGMVNYQDFLEEWATSKNDNCRRLADKLLPLVKQICEITADKYAAVREV